MDIESDPLVQEALDDWRLELASGVTIDSGWPGRSADEVGSGKLVTTIIKLVEAGRTPEAQRVLGELGTNASITPADNYGAG